MNTKINELQVSDLLSFGPKQTFSRFSRFNLFIGKNGSGKSNVLRLIGQLPIETESLAHPPLSVSLTDESGSLRQILAYQMHLSFSSINHSRHHVANYPNTYRAGNLSIKYQIKSSPCESPDCHEIIFESGELISGDLNHLRRLVEYIKLPKSGSDFYYDFARNLRANPKVIAFLNFSLFYIFQNHTVFLKDGRFCEIESRPPNTKNILGGLLGPPIDDYELLPSGIFQCAKILLRFLLAHNKYIVLIDEPEAYLEARTCRRFHQLLVWLCIRQCEADSLGSQESSIRDIVEISWQEWKENLGSMHLAEGEKWEIIDGNIPYPQPKQLFISSHSSVLLNEYLSLGDAAVIYAFNSEYIDNSYDAMSNFNSGLPDENKLPPKTIRIESIFSIAKLVNSSALPILDNLGCKGSDLLQTNGIVWVEGPCDVRYVQKWIEMYLAENELPKLRRGIDYEFQIYGGTLLDSLCLVSDGISLEIECQKLVKMFSFSRNAFVVIDSDAAIRGGEIVDISTFSKAKKFINDQLSILIDDGYKLGIWFDHGNISASTIEDYLDATTIELHPRRSLSKNVYAQKIVETWGNGKRLSDFPHNLECRIAKLVEVIASWNK
jgi:energy-coupling factor transporter ATP-binding protein EcfA2